MNYHCARCGRAIFRGDAILGETNLWDLGDYQANAYRIREAIDLDALRRYDCSLHEGWYCCRFIVMRMVEDKFGTGDDLLVYKDSVIPVHEGEKPPAARAAGHAVRLSKHDFDRVIQDRAPGRLRVLKLGAIWCPPCRLMDSVMGELVHEKALPGVDFFELDVDEEPEIAGRFENQSIPYTLVFYEGQKLEVRSRRHETLDGGVVGGLRKVELRKLCEEALAAARAGRRVVTLA